jgi:osmotically-inducible protein OsmY
MVQQRSRSTVRSLTWPSCALGLAMMLILPGVARTQARVDADSGTIQVADPKSRPTDDARILDVTRQALAADPITASDRIDANVGSGIVTLTGDTRTLLGAERAIGLVRGIPGVRDVNSELVVRPQRQVAASRLEADLLNALRVDPAIEAKGVQVAADDQGAVVLRGTVDSRAESFLVQQVAKSLVGVTSVREEMQVRPDRVRSDAEIEAEVRRMLQWNPSLPNQAIDVSVKDGVVTLSGTVAHAGEQQRAAGLAWVAGVKHVNTVPLTTKAGGPQYAGAHYELQSDEAIARSVRTALERNPRVTATNVQVSVQDRIVTLRGNVGDEQERVAAFDSVRGIMGLKQIRNELQVTSTAASEQ